MLKKIICMSIAIFSAMVFCFANINSSSKSASATDSNSQTSPSHTRILSQSVFIHQPTYSVIFDDHLFFIDDFDNKLKSFNIITNKIENSYLDISDIGIIIDVSYQNENIFLLTTKNIQSETKLYLTIINLSDFSITKSIEFQTDVEYSKLSVLELDASWIISLTPKINNENLELTKSPAIITIDKTQIEVTKYCTISIPTAINQNLFDITLIESKDAVSEIHIVLTYKDTTANKDKICFFGCLKTDISDNTSIDIDVNKGTNFDNLETTKANIYLLSINTITIDQKLMFFITYEDRSSNNIDAYSILYEFVVDNVTDQNKTFVSKLSIQTENNPYVMASNNYICYPLINNDDNNEKILYNTISYNSSQLTYVDNGKTISNPRVNVEYLNEDEFIYVSANKKTKLLSSPWDSADAIEIDPINSEKDLIVIGNGKIEGENAIIGDYKFCLFTTLEENNIGFVKTEDLTQKQEIELKDYKHKVFKVQPNTNLYSLPTTILKENITPTLAPTIVTKIKENSRVEVVDVICEYKSHDDVMLKVKVNNTYIGYIEFDKIIKPSDAVEFVITNASIKEDDTIIYLESNSDSPVIYTLSKGYRIRINGARNTDSGYTSVTFNDEYGNEFSGYILTDSIGSDSWTVMQIIGCVLIAINIGLLVLILKFKKNSIGSNGSKYIDSEK